MRYSEHGNYLKILRIAFTRPLNLSSKSRSASILLSSKIFMPLKKNESIKNIHDHINEWVNHAASGKYHCTIKKNTFKKIIGR